MSINKKTSAFNGIMKRKIQLKKLTSRQLLAHETNRFSTKITTLPSSAIQRENILPTATTKTTASSLSKLFISHCTYTTVSPISVASIVIISTPRNVKRKNCEIIINEEKQKNSDIKLKYTIEEKSLVHAADVFLRRSIKNSSRNNRKNLL